MDEIRTDKLNLSIKLSPIAWSKNLEFYSPQDGSYHQNYYIFSMESFKPAFLPLFLGGGRSKICQSLENVGLQESFQQVFFKLIASSGRLLDPSEPTAKTSKIFVSENVPIPGGHYPFLGRDQTTQMHGNFKGVP